MTKKNKKEQTKWNVEKQLQLVAFEFRQLVSISWFFGAVERKC